MEVYRCLSNAEHG
jgi:hypothetical protein